MPVIPVDGAHYSFAAEYHGPPLTFDLPRAVPINVETIPVASVATQATMSNEFDLPIVQPILSDIPGKQFFKETDRESDLTVSPTSVIGFDENTDQDGASRELNSSGALELSKKSVGCGELSGAICTVTLGSSSISDDQSNELLRVEGGSSGILEYSKSFSKSREHSRNPKALRVSNSFKERFEFDDMNPPDWALSLGYPSSIASSSKTCDSNNGSSFDRRRMVIFCNADSNDDTYEGFNHVESRNILAKKEPKTKPRKGACYRCLKGNRFTEKEACLVCDAKYCANCVLRAMGSMPEGKKCVSCIGFPIEESKRCYLGKYSRMLKRLLNNLEIRQIMKAEKFCEVNQLPSEYIYVNGKPLFRDELVSLQTCPIPPKKLKPGSYWYDKVSGLWGKEGQKPSQVISPHMSVGGPLEANASNGKTQVFINGREITKVEMRMLQLAGVQCAGNPHFWVNEDGSYQEEGQKNTKGFIWGNAGTKLLCTIMSLPVPSKSSSSYGEPVTNPINKTVPGYLDQKILQKLLLIGCGGSGTSTIFKHAKIIYKAVPFSKNELENIKSMIQSSVYGYLGILLEGRERFEEQCSTEIQKKDSSESFTGNSGQNGIKTIYSIGPRLKAFSDWLLKTMVSGKLEAIFPAATREYAPLIEELWNDSALQATYMRRSELEMLPIAASYFLERAVDILKPDYEPSNMDILRAECVTASNGLSSVDFSFPQLGFDDSNETSDQSDSLPTFQLIRAHARGLGENFKWLEMFEDVRIVIFCVSLNEYDQITMDRNGGQINKMMLTRKYFENIVSHPTFYQMDFLLILNKFDLFEEKLERVPLTQCEWFNDFNPIISHHRSNNSTNSGGINSSTTIGQIGFHYIAVKFKRLYSSLTGRKLYVSNVMGLGSDSVDEALRYSREIIKWDEEKTNFSLCEYSIYSTDASFSE